MVKSTFPLLFVHIIYTFKKEATWHRYSLVPIKYHILSMFKQKVSNKHNMVYHNIIHYNMGIRHKLY